MLSYMLNLLALGSVFCFWIVVCAPAELAFRTCSRAVEKRRCKKKNLNPKP